MNPNQQQFYYPQWTQIQIPEVGSMDEVNAYPVQVGQSTILRSTDHKYLFIKTCSAPGQVKVDTYLFQDPPPPPPSPEMVQLNQRLEAIERLLMRAASDGGEDNV